MSKTIAICNQKGGVGKTTTALNLGAGLANEGKHVLVVDLDAQANLTMSLGQQLPDRLENTIATLMDCQINDKTPPYEATIIRHDEGFDLLPSNIQLSAMDTMLVNAMNRERVLSRVLAPLKPRYDYILIDCQPSLGLLTVNALAASNTVLIPAQAHFLSFKGLELLARTIQKVKNNDINRDLSIEGILITMLDKRSNFTREVVEQIRTSFGDRVNVFAAEIPHSIRAVEQGPEGRSIFAYDPNGKVAAAYAALTREVLRHGVEKQRVKDTAR